jgi:hypothetical protein
MRNASVINSLKVIHIINFPHFQLNAKRISLNGPLCPLCKEPISDLPGHLNSAHLNLCQEMMDGEKNGRIVSEDESAELR